MPDLTSSASTFRAGKFSFNGYLAVLPRTVVLGGTVTAVPTYPTLQISYTGTSGSYANVKQDMTVDFLSATGVLKARLRVASGQSVTSGVLPLNEFSAGTYDVAINDTFIVYNEYRIRDRLVSASASLLKDSRIALTDQLSAANPVCNSGGPYAGFGTSVSFAGGTSFTVDPDSSGTITHAWDFLDGTPSTSTSAAPTSVFPVGFRYVKHTATDASNSKATIAYVPTWVFNRTSYLPLRVQVDNFSEQVASGRLTFKLPYGSEGDITSLPDGAPIVLFEQEYRNNTEGSYGSNVSGRSHIKFSGYLVRDSIEIDADQNTVTFEAVNTLEILAQTPTLPQLLISETGTKWSDIPGLTTKLMLWYLSYWGATLQTAWDFVWTDGTDLAYERIAVEGQNIADQLRDIANSLNIEVTCDPLGRIQFIRDPNFLTEVQRAARTTAYNFTTADVIKVDITREHQGNAKTVRGEGITTGNDPVFSNAPGDAPSSIGTGSDTLSKQIVTSQTDLNTRSGYHYARINSLYEGRFVPKGIRLTVPDGYDILQVGNREFVTLTLPASTNTRGISFGSSERWTVEGKDITYDVELGTKDITYTLDHETTGVAGVTYVPPQEGDNGLPDLPEIDVDFPSIGVDPVTGIGIDAGASVGGVTSPATKTMAAFCGDNKMYLTANFSHPEASGGPTWTATDLTALSGWGGGTLLIFEADPYSASYLGTGSTVDGWLVTTTKVQKISDIFGTPTLGTAVSFTHTSSTRTMMADRGVQNFVIVASWDATHGVYAAVTTNGSAWTETQVRSYENTDAGGLAPGVFISPHTAGTAYISVWTATGDNTTATAAVYKTTNYGSSWSLLTSPAIDSGVDISSTLAVPFSNTAGTTIYHRKKTVADGITFVRNVSGVETDITPTTTLSYVPIGELGHEIALPDDDNNTLAMIGATGAALEPACMSFDIGNISGYAAFGTYLGEFSGVQRFQSEFYPTDGQYYLSMITPDKDTCCLVRAISVVSGSIIGASHNLIVCGDAQIIGNFNAGSNPVGETLNYLAYASGAAFTLDIDFGDPSGGTISYALLETENCNDDEPTWANIDSGETFPYRQVFSIGSGKYLVIGLLGSIGIADSSGVDSRMGNIMSVQSIVGTAGI